MNNNNGKPLEELVDERKYYKNTFRNYQVQQMGFVNRMIEEQAQLKDRIDKANAFLSDSGDTLELEAVFLLENQIKAMELYNFILTKRIYLHQNITPEPNIYP